MIRGDRVRQLRRDAGMTQVALAEALGITQGFLSQVEAGQRDVSTKTLVELATILKVSVDFLLGVEESGIDKESESQPAATSQVGAL